MSQAPKTNQDMTRLRFGSLAIATGTVPRGRVAAALAEQAREGNRRKLGEILLSQGAITLEQVIKLLSRQGRFPVICESCRETFYTDMVNPHGIADDGCPKCNGFMSVAPGSLRKKLRKPSPFLPKKAEPVITPGPRTAQTGLSRYELGQEIARDRHSRVIGALDRMLGRKVSIKISEKTGDSGQTNYLFNGARISSILNHPNILPILDIGQTPAGRGFCVMPRVTGPSLGTILLRHSDHPSVVRLYTLRTLVEPLRGTVKALALAHQKGIAHGRVTSNRILTSLDGSAFLIGWGGAVSRKESPDSFNEACQKDVHAIGKLLMEIIHCCMLWHSGPRWSAEELRYKDPLKQVAETAMGQLGTPYPNAGALLKAIDNILDIR